MPKFAGNPMATPEPPVTRGMPLSAGPSLRRSSLDTASTIAMCTSCFCNSWMRRRIASAPRSTTTVIDEPDTPAALRLQHPHEVGIRHRCQRVILHAAFVQQYVADEQIAAEHCAAVIGKCWSGDREADAVGRHRVQQCLRDRPDIAIGRAVEGRAVLEVDLPWRPGRFNQCSAASD